MKYSLRFLLLSGYLFLFGIMLFLVNTYGRRLVLDKLVADETQTLHTTAEQIAATYQSNPYLLQSIPGGLKQRFISVELLTGIRTWVVDTEGIIRVDSHTADNQERTNLSSVAPDFLGNQFISDVTIPQTLDTPHLCVIYPVTSSMQTSIYVVLLSSQKRLSAQADTYVDTLVIGLVALAVPCFLFLLLISTHITLSSKKITQTAKEYAQGRFDYPTYRTKEKHLSELATAIRYLADKMESMDDYQKKFIANISHDFRSPLTSIRGYTGAIRDGTIPPEQQDKYLNIILFETERLTKLTSNLLTLNQLENNGMLLETTTFDINSELRQCLLAFEQRCKKKQISLKFSYDEKELFVDADQLKIERVIQNLTDNAIKFSPDNSIIEIHTTSRQNVVFVSIKDHGIGIPKESINKIWDRFYKTDLSRGKDKKGTGLGLSITKEIVEAHGEHINVISTENVGTEFIFTLPLHTGETQT